MVATNQIAYPRAGQKFCYDCDATISTWDEVCPRCGVGQLSAYSPYSESRKNRMVAALLALFLGGLGVQKFYLGQPVKGIMALLFCWTFVPAVMGVIEGLRYLTMSDSVFARRYG